MNVKKKHNLVIYKNDKPKYNKKRIVIASICILIVAVALGRSVDKFSPSNVIDTLSGWMCSIGFGNGYPTPIIGSCVKENNFSLMNDNISFVSDSSFVILTDSAKIITNRQHSFGNPVLKTGGNRAIIYNLGGRDFRIDSLSNLIYKSSLDQNIVAGAISKAGTYAVITESKKYLSELIVFSSNNEEIYRYYFANYYINNVEINEKGDFVAVSGLSSDNGVMKSIIYTFELNGDEPKDFFEFENNMIFSLHFIGGRNILSIGDNMTSYLKGSKRKDYNYDSKRLITFDIDKKEGVALVFSEDEDLINCQIVVLNKEGTVKSEISTDSKIKSVAYKYNKIMTLEGDKIKVYSLSGKLKKQDEARMDARKVKITAGNRAYILGVSEIRKVRI